MGAIGTDRHFDFSACTTHNDRDFLGGFGDWVETVAESLDALDYRRWVSDSETASVWQSLAFGPNSKVAYYLAVCPAGVDVIGPILEDRKEFLKGVVDPLQQKEETLLVVAGSDAQAHAKKRFSHKRIKPVGNELWPSSIRGFLRNMPHVFQRHQSEGRVATDPITFTGAEPAQATVVIRDKAIRVQDGHVGTPDLSVTADSRAWVGFLRKEQSLIGALLRRKIRLKVSPRLLLAIRKCFPS